MSIDINIDLSLTTIKQELPDFIHQEIAHYARVSNTYHHQPEELRSLLAKRHGVPIEHVFLTAGADQAIMLLGMAYGERTHIFTPTYISYTDVKLFGGQLDEHYALNDSGYSISTSVLPDATLIFLANPNNPAGFTDKKQILELVQNNPETVIAVDEAYGDFVDQSVADEVRNYQNLVVIRSFSKGFSLAGYRIGYMLADPKVTKKLAFESTWFNIAHTSVGAAIAALEHEDYFRKIRLSIIAERIATEKFLISQGYRIIPSQINAVLLMFDKPSKAQSFVQAMKTAGIVVNQGNVGSNYGLNENFVRVSIGTPEHMQHFQDSVQRLI